MHRIVNSLTFGMSIVAVSYTHLDVYKRQAVYLAVSTLIQSPIFSVGIGLASIVPSVLMINTKIWLSLIHICLLSDFLYEAIYIPDGTAAPPKSVITCPELQVYIADFGNSKHDKALICLLYTSRCV